MNHDPFARLQPFIDDREPLPAVAETESALFDFVVLADDEDVRPSLVYRDRGLRYDDDFVAALFLDDHAEKGGDKVVVIPQSATAVDQTGSYVFVVGQDNKVEQRRVRIGTVRDGLAVVNEGIEPGERVVIQGQQRIRAGVTVTPELASSAAG